MYRRTVFLGVVHCLLYFSILKSNDIVAAVLKDSESSLFVDDFALCLRGRSLPSVIRWLQLCVNSVNKWVQENGFKFSVSKTEYVHFTNQRGVLMEPDIKMDWTSIIVADEAKFLELVFDRQLTFRAHVKYLKTVCDKTLNVLRVVGHTNWDADKVVLLRLYRALVRSKLDNGCIVYGTASKSVLTNRIQFTTQVYAFVWELFVLPPYKVSTSRREKLLYLWDVWDFQWIMS